MQYTSRVAHKKNKKLYIYILLSIVTILIFSKLLHNNMVKNDNIVQVESMVKPIEDTPNIYIDKEKIILVNRENLLDSYYVPDDLVELNVKFVSKNNKNRLLDKEAATNLEDMFEDAKNDGIHLLAVSGYRSYDYQKNLYNNKVRNLGKAEADKYSAPPGASEHQTGLAIDILSREHTKLTEGFKNTKAYKWMCENIHKYGYIIRYQEGKEDITGYQFEPWHLRYVGQDLATELKDLDITLEEYYDLYLD